MRVAWRVITNPHRWPVFSWTARQRVLFVPGMSSQKASMKCVCCTLQMRLSALAALLPAAARAALVYSNFSDGTVTTIVAFNDSLPVVAWSTPIYNATTRTVYIYGNSRDYQLKEAVCMPTLVTQVLIQPAGCDNVDPDLAYVNSNCATDAGLAAANLATLLSSWYLPWAPGLPYQFGPVVMLGLPPGEPYTDLNLLRAQGVALHAGATELCALPTTVFVRIDMPYLVVTSSCLDFEGELFSGLYEADRSEYSETVQFQFDRYDAFEYQEMYFSRVAVNSLYFNLVLTDSVLAWTSSANFTDFADLDQNTTYLLYNASASSCSFSYWIHGSSRQLLPPPEITSLNYFQNQFPQHYYVGYVCNHNVGYLSATNQLAIPGCMDGDYCGGDGVFTTATIPALPLYIPPNPNVLVMTCAELYPPGDFFYSFALSGDDGPMIQVAPNQYVCNFPFFRPDQIAAAASLNERWNQCFMFGGVTATLSRSYCQRARAIRECRQGWLPFFQYCYFNANYFTDANMIGRAEDAEATCQAIQGTSVWTLTDDIDVYLSTLFVFYQPEVNLVYRVTLETGFQQCYSLVLNSNASANATYVATKSICNGEAPAFPVCRYAFAQSQLFMSTLMVSPLTRALLQSGQGGLPHRGEFYQCGCYAGWTTTFCDVQTCVPPNSNESSALVSFFSQCYFNGQGSCDNGQPRICVCQPYYGPAASVDPSLPFYQNLAYPCVCPASSTHLSFFYIINGELFNDTAYPMQYTPCGGIANGQCVANAAAGLGRCACNIVRVLNPDSLVPYQPAFDGAACTCPVPILPADGYENNGNIVARFCNARGTCCPAGEREADQLTDGDPSGFVGRCPPDTDGCLCDNGQAGTSCTCPVAPNLAYGQPQVASSYLFYVDLLSLLPVRLALVNLLPVFVASTCTPVAVSVLTSVGAAGWPCTLNNTREGQWTCPDGESYPGYDGFARYVQVETLEAAASCSIEVYENDDPPCGVNGNPFAARFYANEFYRSPIVYNYPQKIEFGPFGCTDSVCLCNPDFGGNNCAFGVSGYRVNVDGNVVQYYCGEATLNPRGVLGTSGCQCNPFTSAQVIGGQSFASFIGAACECVVGFNVDDDAYEVCFGHGTCVTASFSYGSCQFDLADQAADPLNNPYAEVVSASQQAGMFVFADRDNSSWDDGVGDMRSVIAINGESWLLTAGQQFTIPTLTGSFEICGHSAEFPVNITYACDDTVMQPQRTLALMLLDYGAYNDSVLCDPAAFSGDYVCPLRTYCGVSPVPCIVYQFWQVLNNSEQLDVGAYQNVWFPCAKATIITPIPEPSVAGDLSCNSAVDRTIDKAVWLATTEPLQCNGSITPFSNVLGEAYGLFQNQIPGLSFVQGVFGPAQYAFVAQVINNQRWFAENVSYNLLDGQLMDAYYISWINATISQEANVSVSPASYDFVNLQNPANWDFEGVVGSPFIDLDFLKTGSTQNLVIDNRYGAGLAIVRQDPARQFTVTAPFVVRGLQLVATEGVCATFLGPAAPGTAINLGCVSNPWTLAQVLNFTIMNNVSQAPAAAAQYNSSAWFLLYYDAEGTVNSSMVFVSGRPTSYDTLWTALTTQIVAEQQLPFNYPLLTAYQAVPGLYSRAIDLADADDLSFVMQIWQNFLAARRCTADWECKTWYRHASAVCEFSSLGATDWLNGDPSYHLAVTGNEGGCDCPAAYSLGFYDPQTFCEFCQAAYGPNNRNEWLAAVNYQNSILLAYPGLGYYPVFDPSVFPPYTDAIATQVLCKMPVFTSTRPTQICGGRGNVTVVPLVVNETVQLFPNPAGNLLTPACTYISLNSTVMFNNNDSIAAQSFSGGGMRANIIQDTMYLRIDAYYQMFGLVSCSSLLPFNCLFSAPVGITLSVVCFNDASARISSFGELWTDLFQ